MISLSDPNAVERDVDSWLKHERFNSLTLENDISMIAIRDALAWSEFVAPAAMPSFYEDVDASRLCRVSGWGSLSEGASTVQDLRYVDIPYVDAISNTVDVG